MSIDDERDLYERLGRAVETISPRPAPVDGAMRRGRMMRWRRRSVVAAGLAAAVAAGVIAVPSLRNALQTPPPAASHYTATVQLPGPNAPPGLIGWGTVNGQHWQLTADKPGTKWAGHGEQVFTVSGPAFGPNGQTDVLPALTRDTTDPVTWQALSDGPTPAQATQVQFGVVRADVSQVMVRMGNGIVLTLHPVDVWGVRVVAFAVPVSAEITEATAYSRHGVIATAIPFNYPGTTASIGLWLQPGQHGLSRASGRIAEGNGWSMTAYLGPWGMCLEGSSAGTSVGDCVDTAVTMGTNFLLQGGGTSAMAAGTASASVALVVAYLPGGTTVHVRPVAVGPQKFFAFQTGGRDVVRWKAYDSAGNMIESGT